MAHGAKKSEAEAASAATAPDTRPARPGEETFPAFLARGGVALLDGAMGTMLYGKGVFINRSFEELNLSQPALVREVHEEYLAAGADILETNTFAGNRFRLAPHGLGERVADVNRAGARIAREVARGRAWVAGAIGPLGVRIEPFGALSRAEAREVFREQASALLYEGVDLVILETFVHLPELEEAIRGVREAGPDGGKAPIVAQVSVETDGSTREGVSPETVAERLAAAGVEALGVNCSAGPLAALEAAERMRRVTRLPVSILPNAGQPRNVDGRNIYLASPEYLASCLRRAIRAGVRLVGGCCGTTPAHIRAIRQVIGEIPPAERPPEGRRTRTRRITVVPVASEDKTGLSRALAGKRFVTGVEVVPPNGWDVHEVVRTARKLREAGVTFLGLPEGPRGGARMPPLFASAVCRREVDLETVVHYSCRDRGLVRMQADLLGAFATGVTNLLIVTGDPTALTDRPGAAPPPEVDSIGLVNVVARLNQGEDIGGNPIGRPTALHVGVRLDPGAPDLEKEVSRHRWKVDAGAEFVVTSPIFDVAAFADLLKRLPGPALPVIATVWPLRSAREAEFFEQDMAQVRVPAPIVERMRAAEAKGTEADEGIAIARELAAALRPLVRGLQVAAPGGRVDAALAVLGG
ncbi:MAG: bifunctional homocysteine S-methyltransferase/methylenetetrahydrofolate reductase [Planctomycetales bacterium]|nr:bifunctional homocysteine S-methyltransferase/methylenetetrahydrofolate reductase [Planctomycetales bacterium]